MIRIEATHYSATLHCEGVRIPVPGAVGKAEEKNMNRRVRDRLFNKQLAEVYLATDPRIQAPLRALKKS